MKNSILRLLLRIVLSEAEWTKLQCKIQKFEKTLHFALCTFNSWASQEGQALVTLLFFSIIAATITSAATIIILVNSQGASALEQGALALSIAESGAENALLRLMRDPTYANESVPLDGGTALIEVTGSNPKTIRSEGTMGSYTRIVELEVQINNNIYTITSWKEAF